MYEGTIYVRRNNVQCTIYVRRKKKRILTGALFHSLPCGEGEGGVSLAVVFLIVLLAADFPEVRVHRGLAVRSVLLRSECGLVSTDLHQILCAGCHGCTNGCKTVAFRYLICTCRCTAFVAVGVERVQTLAVRALGRSTAVGCHQIISVIVTVHLFRSFQCALDILNTCGAYFCFCHSRSAIGSHWSIPLR